MRKFITKLIEKYIDYLYNDLETEDVYKSLGFAKVPCKITGGEHKGKEGYVIAEFFQSQHGLKKITYKSTLPITDPVLEQYISTHELYYEVISPWLDGSIDLKKASRNYSSYSYTIKVHE